MDSPTGVRAWLAVYLKGACMGAADTVPGVSGGTIAVIVGVYERLITALTSFDPNILRELPRIHTASGRATIAEELVRMDVPFLLVLGAGVLTAAATIATAMHTAVVEYPAPTYAFFFGLIAASAVVLYRYVDAGTPRRILVGIVGFLLAFIITDPALNGATGSSLPMLFVAGAIAISAMVLPGISGAFLLLVLGQYEYISGLPRSAFEGIVAAVGGDFGPLSATLPPLAAFLGGALVGVFSVAYAVRAALNRYREATLVFLISLMLGALRLPATEVATNVGEPSAATALLVIVPLVLGGGAVLALDHYTDDLEY